MNDGKNPAKSKLRIFLALLMAFVMAFSIFILAACKDDSKKEEEEDPDTEEEEEIDLSVTNGSFDLLYDTSETSDYPRTPKSWSYSVDGEGDLKAPSSSSDVLHGVIPVSEDKFTTANKVTNDEKKFGDISNPLTPHSSTDEKDKKQILMLYNKAATAVRYKSPSITIDANSYAVLSVWVKTVDIVDGSAHINLIGAVEEPVYLKDIKTTTTDNNGYVQYKFFIEGSDTSAKTVYLELGLGYGDKYDQREHSKGHVFFDDVELTYLSQKDYVTQKTASNVAESIRVNGEPFDDNTVYMSASNNAVEYSFLANTPLISTNNILPYDASAPSSWTNSSNLSGTALGTNFSKAEALSSTSFSGSDYKSELDEMVKNYPFQSNKLLYMENKTRITQSFISPITNLQPYSYYKLSFWVKTTDLTDTAGLNVFLTNGINKNFYPSNPSDKQYKAYSSFASINTKDNEKDLKDKEIAKKYKWDNWVYYSFVVQTGIYAGENIQLEFSLGPQYGNAYDETLPYKMPLGAALATEINLEEMTKTGYDSVATSSTTNKSTISSEGGVDTETIANGGFTSPQSSYQGLDFTNGPLAPSDWLGAPYSHKQVGGNGISQSDYNIINGAGFKNGIYNKFGTSSLDVGNPTALMVESTTNFAYGYMTPYKSLSANSYYKISIDVLATNGTKFGIYFVDDKGKILGDANYKELDTSGIVDVDKAKDYELYASDYRKSMYVEATGTASANDTTAWKTYTFYIKTGSEAKNYRLELWFGHMKYELQDINGDNVARANTEMTTGTVLFDNALALTSTEDTFKDLRKDLSISDDKMMFKSADMVFADYARADPEQPEEEEEEEEETPENENKVNWGLIVTAISTGLIIIALGIVAGRKLYLARKKAKIGIPDEHIESKYDKDLKRHYVKGADGKKSEKADDIELEDDMEEVLDNDVDEDNLKEETNKKSVKGKDKKKALKEQSDVNNTVETESDTNDADADSDVQAEDAKENSSNDLED